jgi:GntR family transcriptional regulator
MFIRIEKGSSVPISKQIAEQIRAQCLSGALPAGERLPSVRELAQELAVNLNTILRVYERLAGDQLIELRHGDGTFVRPLSNQAGQQLETQRKQFLTEFESVVRRGLLLGYRVGDLRRKLEEFAKLPAGR